MYFPLSLSLSKSSLKFFRKWARDWCSHWHRCTRERVQITSTTELIITTFAVDMQLSYDLIACIKRIFKYSTMIWFRKRNGKTLSACMASILITAFRWLLRCTVIFWWGNLNQYTNGENQTTEQKKNTKWKKNSNWEEEIIIIVKIQQESRSIKFPCSHTHTHTRAHVYAPR